MTRHLPPALICLAIVLALAAIVVRVAQGPVSTSKRELSRAASGVSGPLEGPSSSSPKDPAALLGRLAEQIAKVKAHDADLEVTIPTLMTLHKLVFDQGTRSESIRALRSLACDSSVDLSVRQLALMLLGGAPDSTARDGIRKAMTLGPSEVAFYAILALSMTSFDERPPADSYPNLVRRRLAGESANELAGLNLKFAEEFWEFCLGELSGESLDPAYKKRLAAKYLRDAVQRDVPEENVYASVFSRINDLQSLQTLSKIFAEPGNPGLRIQALELLTSHSREIQELMPALSCIAATVGEDASLRKAAISLLWTRGGVASYPILERVIEDEMRSASPQYSVCECALSAMRHLAPESLISGRNAVMVTTYLDRVCGTQDGSRAISNFMVFLAGSENTSGAEDLLLSYARRNDNPRIADAAVRAMGSCPDSTALGVKRLEALNKLLESRGTALVKVAVSSILNLSLSMNQRTPKPNLLPLIQAAYSQISARLRDDPSLGLDEELMEAYRGLLNAQSLLGSSSDK